MNGVYFDLANAVVLQATIDWEESVEIIRKMKHSKRRDKKSIIRRAKRRKADCEEFFKSAWFVTLTNLDGKQLLKDLEKKDKDKQKAKFNVANVAG